MVDRIRTSDEHLLELINDFALGKSKAGSSLMTFREVKNYIEGGADKPYSIASSGGKTLVQLLADRFPREGSVDGSVAFDIRCLKAEEALREVTPKTLGSPNLGFPEESVDVLDERYRRGKGKKHGGLTMQRGKMRTGR